MKYLLFISIFIISTLLSLPLAAQSATSDSKVVPGEYIVKYNTEEIQEIKKIAGVESYSDEEVENALTEIIGANKIEDLDLIDATTIKAVDGKELDIEATANLIEANLFEYISPNFIRSINAVPNDPMMGELWGLNQTNNDIDINGPEAWDKISPEDTKDVIVAVIDTGIDYNHPDLRDNMWVNDAEKNGQSGVDDDQNGVVDDIHGYNAINNSGNPLDDQSHGTHCAGTIGAVGNNGIGIVGVAWKVKLMALKFLSASGSGNDADAIKAINYAVQMKAKYPNLRVLSNSWGGSGYNQAMLNAIIQADKAGLVFTAAAGNDGKNNNGGNYYPTNYDSPNVISVAAIDQNGNKASFSNFGSTAVDLAAPGVGIKSTVLNNGYASYNGTSMATPHVSGVAALAIAKSPELTPAEVRTLLMSTIKPIAALNGLMLAPGVINAAAVISDSPSNTAPELVPIGNQTINPKFRSKKIPLLAFDINDDTLTYTAKIVLPAHLLTAANVDQTYSLQTYQPQFDNFYRIGEKRIVSNDNKTYFLFSDGGFYELIFPYYYHKANVDPLYFVNPNLLTEAYPINTSGTGILTLTPGEPWSLKIDVNPNFNGSFKVLVSVSDGSREDAEEIVISLAEPNSCT